MKSKKSLIWSVVFLVAFVLWTALVCMVDVRPIGPMDSSVGFATVNCFMHELIGEHMLLYVITDWLSLAPLMFIPAFAMVGLLQLIKRKSLRKVDFSIIALGGFYAVVLAVFVLFEIFAVNYRPVLIEGVLEASYPSSTTMLVMCVMPTAAMQLNSRIKNAALGRTVSVVIYVFMVLMVIGRLVSGVHWFTDIVAGALLSAGLVLMYRFVVFE